MVVLGAVLAVVGLLLIWTATRGSEWNSTHTRLGRRAPHVSEAQQRYNSVAGLIGGIACVVLGVVAVIVR